MAIAGKVLLRARGDYSNAITYEILDWVRYDGKSWVCRQQCQGIEPPNSVYWSVLAKDGSGSSVMKGATDTKDGESGTVPTPLIADKDKFLKGDGTWSEVNVDDKANGKGMTFEVRNGIPYLKYQIIDEQIETMMANIFDDDNTNDVQSDPQTEETIVNIFDDDPTNDAPQDADIDRILNDIYN